MEAFSPERAQDNSPGQRPGIRCNKNLVAPRSTIEKGDEVAWGKKERMKNEDIEAPPNLPKGKGQEKKKKNKENDEYRMMNEEPDNKM